MASDLFFMSCSLHQVLAFSRQGWMAMQHQQAVKGFLLADSEFSGLDARMVDAQKGVDVVHGLRPHVGELFDFGRGVLDLPDNG
jgi:hypothetical protein